MVLSRSHIAAMSPVITNVSSARFAAGCAQTRAHRHSPLPSPLPITMHWLRTQTGKGSGE